MLGFWGCAAKLIIDSCMYTSVKVSVNTELAILNEFCLIRVRLKSSNAIHCGISGACDGCDDSM